MRDSSIYLNVEPYGGSAVASSISDMIALAKHLRIDVWANLNGVRLLARPDDREADLLAAWDAALNSRLKVAATHQHGGEG